MFTRSEVIVLTNRCRWKHPKPFAMLRCWVLNCAVHTSGLVIVVKCRLYGVRQWTLIAGNLLIVISVVALTWLWRCRSLHRSWPNLTGWLALHTASFQHLQHTSMLHNHRSKSGETQEHCVPPPPILSPYISSTWIHSSEKFGFDQTNVWSRFALMLFKHSIS